MTDQEYQRIYDEGKKSARHDYGLHGPTLKEILHKRTKNPYVGIEAQIWDHGYRQDVRRVKMEDSQ